MVGAWLILTGPGCAPVAHRNRIATHSAGPSQGQTVVRGQGPADGQNRAGAAAHAGAPAASTSVSPPPPIPNPASEPLPGMDLVPAPLDFSPDLSGPGPIIQPATPVDPGGLSPWGLSSIAPIAWPTEYRVSPGRAHWLLQAPALPGLDLKDQE